MNELKRIRPLAAQKGDYISRSWEGCPPTKIERILSIFSQGTSVKGHQYVCGYSDYFGDEEAKGARSFSASEEDFGKDFRVEIYTSRALNEGPQRGSLTTTGEDNEY